MAKLNPLAVYGLLRELRLAAERAGPLAVSGEPDAARALAEALRSGGAHDAVRERLEPGAEALVQVLAGRPGDEDAAALGAAHRAAVPIVLVAPRGVDTAALAPYVLATDVVRAEPGAAVPVDAVARALGRRLGERGTHLAARLPVLRGPLCEELVATFARRAGLIGAAVFVPGADLPVLTLLQLRLVLRIAAAHGERVDSERLPEILAVVGGGLGLRAAARQALGAVPVAGWAVKGGVAYAGTRAIGEAALRYFESRARAVRNGS